MAANPALSSTSFERAGNRALDLANISNILWGGFPLFLDN